MTPFEIDPCQIEQLGSAFGVFICHLLEAEQAAHGIAGHHLTFNRNETTPDGGVDAALTDSTSTSWLPPGDSAWQFKQSNPAAKECAAELEGATWAHEYLKQGGHYVMVQGRRMVDKAIKARAKALQDKAIDLGLIADTTSDRARIRVYDANQLARWASQYTALTLDPTLQIPLGPLVSYDQWMESRRHQGTWVREAHRTQIAAQLVAALRESNEHELRVEGPSGIGKTRLVMEALKDDALRKLVAYGPDATKITPETMNYLIAKARTAILVFDECTRNVHEKLAEQLPTHANLRLVTIGHADERLPSMPLYVPRPMLPADIEAVLQANRPTLWVEARRFVGENCAGNVQMAFVLADHLLKKGVGQAAELMQRRDLEAILAIVFPTDQDLLLMAALALFDRIGWEGHLAVELETVAEFCHTTVANLKRVGRLLEEQDLLEAYGRYRSVVPNPVAIYLAARAWDVDGQRIIDDLLPKLLPDMMRALFARVADLGRYEPVSRVLEQLLALEGLFGTLEKIESHDVGEFLVQLAIVLPERTVKHIDHLIASVSLDELSQRRTVRRSLVIALQKLAWNTATFQQAADALLRLALAENESYANNATGSWTELFGMMLPATAASPEQRLAYLLDHFNHGTDQRVRTLIVGACEAGLPHEEMIMISAELQEGVAVEPRGSARTYEEAANYGRQLVAFLSKLAADEDDEVAHAAFKAFAERLNPTFLNSPYGEELQSALVGLGPRFNKELRAEVARARGWAERANDTAFLEVLDTLTKKLPDVSGMEKLQALATLGSWQVEGPLKEEMNEVVAQVLHRDGLDAITSWLSSNEVNAAWNVGSALAEATHATPEVRDVLAQATKDPTALAGFLRASEETGDSDAFDDFLDSAVGNALPKEAQLFLTMRGPASPRAKARAVELALSLPPKKAVWTLVGWAHDLEPDQVVVLLQRWLTVELQEDYGAIIDWLAFWVHGRPSLPEPLRGLVWSMLKRRVDSTNLGEKSLDWCEIAKYFVTSDATNLASLLFGMAASKHLMLGRREETALLTECSMHDPSGVWAAVMPYLSNMDWRFAMDLQDWFLHSMPISVITDWIGDSVERARTIARITHPGSVKPTELGRVLLTHFSGDDSVSRWLEGQYRTGSWEGSWSSHLRGQIEQLEGWVHDEGASSPVGTWAQDVIDSLKQELKQASQDEAERR